MIIYKITNNINGKIYVGQTKHILSKRFMEHCSSAKKGSSQYIHKSIRKYGKENFIIEEIELCNSFEQLNEREIYWIKQLNSLAPLGYNLISGGGGGDFWKGKILSDKHRLNISKSLKGKVAHNKGKTISTEIKEKIRKSVILTKSKMDCSHSNETKKLISEKTKFIMQTPDVYKRMSEKNRLNSQNPEIRKKISNSLMGNKNPNYGKKWTEEQKLKASESHKLNWQNRKIKEI